MFYSLCEIKNRQETQYTIALHLEGKWSVLSNYIFYLLMYK